jgi:aspartate/methionine/tyrosine aminotransferase
MGLFSSKTPRDLSPNGISKRLESENNREIIQLTESNPTLCGFHYPEGFLLKLADESNQVYQPQPKGTLNARKALRDYLKKRGLLVSEEQLILTASTSEAYSYLFKLLGDAGDPVLIPCPGYPLLEHLVRMESLDPLSYRSKKELGWPLDRADFENKLLRKPKILVSVNPQNPTGVSLSSEDLVHVLGECSIRNIPFISDEVFGDFLSPMKPYRPYAPAEVLSFRLGGISKSLGLPQLKLAWISVEGPHPLVEEALERLEFIADTYLSVQTPVQTALPHLLSKADEFQRQALERFDVNGKFLLKAVDSLGSRVRLLPCEGGWYRLLEVLDPPFSDEQWVLKLLQEEGVFIQPGCFYDLEGCLGVISLLLQPSLFEKGVSAMAKHLEKMLSI